MEMVSSGSLAAEIGWSKAKVESLCRSYKVPKINSKASDDTPQYLILDKGAFYKALVAMEQSGESVTAKEKRRRKNEKSQAEAAESRKKTRKANKSSRTA